MNTLLPRLLFKCLTAFCLVVATAAMAQTSEPREFVVYFEQDEQQIAPEARAVVEEAANYHRQYPQLTLLVWGHADTLGTRWHNLRLSRRRARTIGRALIEAGVPPSLIVLRWTGETRLPHPTRNGTYEPLNRCVIITVGIPIGEGP